MEKSPISPELIGHISIDYLIERLSETIDLEYYKDVIQEARNRYTKECEYFYLNNDYNSDFSSFEETFFDFLAVRARSICGVSKFRHEDTKSYQIDDKYDIVIFIETAATSGRDFKRSIHLKVHSTNDLYNELKKDILTKSFTESEIIELQEKFK